MTGDGRDLTMRAWVHWLRGALRRTAAALLVCGCTPGADVPRLPQYVSDGYRLGGGDEVRIITFGEDQLTGEFTVDDRSKIALPLLGAIDVAGATPEQLGQRIASALRNRNLLHDASVSVQVIAYRPIFVLGEVNKPGQYPYQPGMTMLTAVAIAGGFTYRAVEDYASDVRTIDGEVKQGTVTPGSFLAPGDVLKVYQRRF
jgi:polysaccharide export outer membrane protein